MQMVLFSITYEIDSLIQKDLTHTKIAIHDFHFFSTLLEVFYFQAFKRFSAIAYIGCALPIAYFADHFPPIWLKA